MLALSSLALIAASFQTVETVPHSELIIEARDISRAMGSSVWPDLTEAPETVLLIAGETEYLICHHRPVEGFVPRPELQIDGCSVETRERVFAPHFLASFPAVDGTPTIVVGTPEATNRDPDDWMVTLLHEHVHQMQDAMPGAWQNANALGLHGGDTSGMWMLNYPFDYDGAAAAARALADQALVTLEARGTATFEMEALEYAAMRTDFLASLTPADARYYDFQVWKEGVARWSELAITRSGRNDARLAPLHARQETRLLDGLRAVDLTRQQRVAFYAMGSAEAEILETLAPEWRQLYQQHMFDMSAIFEATIERED